MEPAIDDNISTDIEKELMKFTHEKVALST